MRLIFKLYTFLLVLSVYLPDFGTVDMSATQWLYISSLNSAFFFILLFYNKLEFKKTIKNQSFLLYSLFFIFSIISLFKSINYSESLLKLNEIFVVFSCLFLLISFYESKLVEYKFILILISFALGLEVIGSLNQYRLINSFTEFNFSMANEIRGFTGNKNVAAASVAFKIPFLVLLFDELRSKNRISKILIAILLIASFYVIMLYSARAVFLSIFLSLIMVIGLIVSKRFFFKRKITFLYDIKQILIYILPLIVAFIIFSSKYNNSERIAVQNRIESIVSNTQDNSIQERLRFYGHAVTSIKTNPLFGIGIGNWKIYSIKYDAKNMYSYVVPFFAHNDLLEIFAEIGVFGFIFLLLFYFKIFAMNISMIKNWVYTQGGSTAKLILLIPIIIYFVDLNLNFPSSRPFMQVQLLIYIILLYYIVNTQTNIQKNNDKK